jgi:hypothetical protein
VQSECGVRAGAKPIFIQTSFAKEELTTLASPLVTSLSIVYYPQVTHRPVTLFMHLANSRKQVGYQVVIPQRPDVALGELVKCATLEYQVLCVSCFTVASRPDL